MKVVKGAAVSLDYSLHLGDGDVIDRSSPGDPLVYLHGEGQIVPGLERELEGKEAGAKLQVTVPPPDGYGESDPNGVQKVPRAAFPAGFQLAAGQELMAEGPGGEPLPFVVQAVEGETVTVDFNHPLAGKTLHFEVQVLEVREATAEELAHGHVHGPHGHDH
jgi:FKBP-type peptidyl-prolyl cis-trans isomerase SlyD